jgi:hypothetical protein
MKKNRLLCVILAVFALVTLASLSVSGSLNQSQTDSDEALPRGKWTVSANPYFGADYKSLPVVVVSVTSDSAKGLKITKVGVYNRSSKPITAVRFGWYLTTRQDTHTILKQGQSPLIMPSGGLPMNVEREIEFPIVSFGRVARSLVGSGELKGDFRIQVVANEIQYEDGSTWTREEAGSVAFSKANYRASLTPAAQGSGSCAHQTCAAYAENGSVRYYYCVRSLDINQFCENHNTYCTNRICGGPVEL